MKILIPYLYLTYIYIELNSPKYKTIFGIELFYTVNWRVLRVGYSAYSKSRQLVTLYLLPWITGVCKHTYSL